MTTILIIEDVPGVRMLLALALSDRYTVLEANGGEEGVRMFREHKIDLVITDLSMPNFDGFQVMREIKALDPTVKIIAHSALIPQPDVRAMALAASADACLAKPVSLDQLDRIV